MLRIMMKIINNGLSVFWVLFLLALCSCGELTEFPSDDSSHVASIMKLDYHEAYLMAGDSIQLSALFEPDSVTLSSIFWYADKQDYFRLGAYGVVSGIQPGQAYVHAISESSLLQDSCLVHVITRLDFPDLGLYPYDMVIYACDEVDGHPLTSSQIVAAIVSNEVRGFGEILTLEATGQTFLYMRIYSGLREGEIVEFWLYDRQYYQLYKSATKLPFDINTHGSASDPIKLNFIRQK